MAVQQAPLALQPLTAEDTGRSVMVVVKLVRQRLGFQFGRLQKFIPPTKHRGKYNFDVQFAGEKGVRGMFLETDGHICKYDAAASSDADEGTWFFVDNRGVLQTLTGPSHSRHDGVRAFWRE